MRWHGLSSLDSAFVLLWTGQSVSQLGSQVTLVALPLTAILLLHASPTQVGWLFATGYAPAAAFGLLAGVWVDRVRRRALLIGCQLFLAGLTLSVPIAGFSAACLLRIRVPEPAPISGRRRGVWAEIQEGLSLVLQHRLIRPIVLSTALYNCFAAAFTAVYTLFMVRELHLDPAFVGLVLAGGGVGGVLGGLVAGRIARRFGVGRTIVGGSILLSVTHLAAPLAIGGPSVTVPLLFSAGVLSNLGAVVSSVNQTSLIQRLVPAHALGRVAATQQVTVLAAVPLGAVVGGVLAEAIGLRPTVGVAAVGTIVAMLALLFSPLARLVEVPRAEDDPEGEPRTGHVADIRRMSGLRHAGAGS